MKLKIKINPKEIKEKAIGWVYFLAQKAFLVTLLLFCFSLLLVSFLYFSFQKKLSKLKVLPPKSVEKQIDEATKIIEQRQKNFQNL